MPHADFVHLHVHSHYSLLDAAATVPQLVKAASKLKMPAMALTDHGAMYGAVEFCQKASKEGVKPIVGCEVYVTEGSRRVMSRNQAVHHLTLLAKNQVGYQNLCRLVSLAFTEGFYFRPRMDEELLGESHEGIIALSGCQSGKIFQYLLAGRQDDAVAAAKAYRELFGEENFYLELCDHGLDKQKLVMPQLIELGKSLGIPFVLTNDSHYVSADDHEAQDHLFCITAGRMLNDERRPKLDSTEYYLKSAEEMRKLFPEVPEAYANTVRIASMCNVDVTTKQKYLPKFDVPGGRTSAEYLRVLCDQALPTRYEETTEDIRKRLDFELSVIEKMGFPAYFLIVWDFIHHARSKGISVGPGRGSAAGSLVAYLLGITNIDPLKYSLVFERFLNPERVSMPDIDIDFDFERRGEVVAYVVEKYGRDNVSKIATFNLLKAKAALKDAARVRGVEFSLSNKISKAIPEELNITLAQALEQSAELRQFAAQDPKLFEIAQKLEGMARNTSIHAAGIVIAPDKIWKYAPLAKNKDEIATQFDMKSLDEIGLLKMDFLGLKTLTLIDNALDNIRKRRKVELDIGRIPMDDKRTYRLLAAGDTVGVFQFESSGFKELLKRLKPTVFEDLIAVIALYRPGPLGSGMVDDFIDGKHGKKKVVYPHAKLEGILKETYGVMLYQEQVMQCASIMAGYSLGEADQLRRAMGKKKPDEMERQRARFLDGAKANEVDLQNAETIFNLMQKFADYGFNKSHSAAYALISYQTAYLKANFPHEFMAAVLTNDRDDTDRIASFIEECRRMGISILPPDVNESDTNFTVVGKAIRFGLSAIKGIGDSAVSSVIQARERHGPFPNMETFCRRVDSRAVNKRILESLIKCGALSSFPQNRAQLLAAVELAISLGQDSQRNESVGQMTLADLLSGGAGSSEGGFGVGQISYPEIPEFPERSLLNFERETLGLYLSGHPMLGFQPLLDRITGISTLADLPGMAEDSQFVVAGMVKSVRKVRSKSSGKEMAIVMLEDVRGSVEVPLFSERFEEAKSYLKEDTVVLVWGTIQSRNGEKRLSPDGTLPLEGLFGEKGWKASVCVQTPRAGLSKDQAARMKNILLNHRGRHPVEVFVPVRDQRVVVRLGKEFKVSPKAELVTALEELLGERAVTIQVALPERPPSRHRFAAAAAARGGE
ncbi:MAG: DNA polymerase III subunit alpha [Candidatus Wallbacteria bacterium]|nr:DNA polymerase III subunit alpha [Candidatus Wallbacteria bacterium]